MLDLLPCHDVRKMRAAGGLACEIGEVDVTGEHVRLCVVITRQRRCCYLWFARVAHISGPQQRWGYPSVNRAAPPVRFFSAMADSGVLVCPTCDALFGIDPSQAPKCLSCGHTVCAACADAMLVLVQPRCLICLKTITSAVPQDAYLLLLSATDAVTLEAAADSSSEAFAGATGSATPTPSLSKSAAACAAEAQRCLDAVAALEAVKARMSARKAAACDALRAEVAEARAALDARLAAALAETERDFKAATKALDTQIDSLTVSGHQLAAVAALCERARVDADLPVAAQARIRTAAGNVAPLLIPYTGPRVSTVVEASAHGCVARVQAAVAALNAPEGAREPPSGDTPLSDLDVLLLMGQEGAIDAANPQQGPAAARLPVRVAVKSRPYTAFEPASLAVSFVSPSASLPSLSPDDITLFGAAPVDVAAVTAAAAAAAAAAGGGSGGVAAVDALGSSGTRVDFPRKPRQPPSLTGRGPPVSVHAAPLLPSYITENMVTLTAEEVTHSAVPVPVAAAAQDNADACVRMLRVVEASAGSFVVTYVVESEAPLASHLWLNIAGSVYGPFALQDNSKGFQAIGVALPSQSIVEGEKYGLAVNSAGTMAVVAASHTLVVYDMTPVTGWVEVRRIGGPEPSAAPGKFGNTFKLCFVPGTDNVLVCEHDNARVQEVCVSTGAHVRDIPSRNPRSICCNGELFAVGTFGGHGPAIAIHSYATGSVLRAFAPIGQKKAHIAYCCEGMRFTPDGKRLIVTECEGYRASEFTVEGKFVRLIGERVLMNGNKDVEFTASGDTVIADQANSRVCVFSPQGSLLRLFVPVNSPTALAVAGATLYAMSSHGGSVQALL